MAESHKGIENIRWIEKRSIISALYLKNAHYNTIFVAFCKAIKTIQ